jgi:hypothetical protein
MGIKRNIQAAITTGKIIATVANTHPAPLDKQFAQWQQVRNQTPTSQVSKAVSGQAGKK